MELTAAHRESGGTLAQGPATGPGLAPNTLPVWAVKPWFGISFHGAQLSSVYGVLLYPILDGFARHARLGPRTATQAKLTNANCVAATPAIVRQYEVQCPRPSIPGPRASARWSGNHGPGFMYLNGECFVICGFYKYTLLASTEFNLTVPCEVLTDK